MRLLRKTAAVLTGAWKTIQPLAGESGGLIVEVASGSSSVSTNSQVVQTNAVLSRNGTSSGVANTWTQVMAANTARIKWEFINTSGTDRAILSTDGTDATIFASIPANASYTQRPFSDLVLTTAIHVKYATATSVAYHANEISNS